MHQNFYIFCQYWPDDGPLGQKIVAKNNIPITYYIFVSDGVQFAVLMYFKYNRMSFN